MMGNGIACIFNKTKCCIDMSCTWNRDVNWYHPNSEFLAMSSCLQWLSPCLKLTLRALLRKKDLVSPNCEPSVWDVPLPGASGTTRP